MFESTKVKFMCGLTAASVALGSFAMPVTVWADDDYDDDDYLVDLVDLTDEEEDILRKLQDVDDDYDIDEDDVDYYATAVAVAALEEAEYERQRAAEIERQKQAELERQIQLTKDAEKKAAEAQRKAEEERKKNVSVNGIWVSSGDVTLTTGQTYQLIAGVKPDNARNKGVSFSTSDSRIATVDGSGIIRANGVGSCVITARSSEGGYQAYTQVRVNPTAAVAAQTVAQDANWTGIAANLITAAAPNSTVNLVAPKALSFDRAMINALALRPDVSVAIAYPYNGHAYLLSVPKGYNLAAKMDKNGKVSFLTLAAVKDGKVRTVMTK